MLKNDTTPFGITILCILWLISIMSWEAAAQAPEEPLQNPYAGDDDAIAEGQIFFRSFCWGCHGRKERGGKAPDLLKPQWLHGWSEEGVFHTISNGRPGTGMQKFGGKLTEEEIWRMISYIRMEQAKAAGVSLDVSMQSAKELVPYMDGEVQAGEGVFFSETIACGKCHTVRGKGGYGTGSEIGPDLTYIARTRSPQFLMTSLLNPREYIAPEYETITIITKDGKEVTGRKRKLLDRRGREDPETVQVLDSSGKLWTTYFKKNIKESFTPIAGIMPENFAQILTVKQLHDLFAYLLTLE